jgi:hypothetical protein
LVLPLTVIETGLQKRGPASGPLGCNDWHVVAL